ncbi:Phosducin family protein [Xylona heveae TC161]|uniref:Phosducin family protein n=1 Tax=Xylona heveae (strain CBS 132557 / TC161) TaxID=1328760 RepID=A0A164ZMA7_XYLHT|nr:Phosducin family protein [Xylona heveae TC161]KZF19274.1 Phosducin family protein [Xylona heveae TC161]
MDMPVNVPVDDPNADTEWNDILRKHGVIPEKPPSPTPFIEEALVEARRLAHENRLEGKELDELDELEEEEDEEFLEKYRQQRMAELSTISAASVHNQVYHLQKPDYSRDVTEASKKSFVFVNLTSSLGTNVESRILTELWREAARRFGDVKFAEMRADMCIEGYPERNTPTILIYKDGDIQRQIVTLRELKGKQTKLEDIEQLLISVGAVKQTDSRLSKKPGDEDDDGQDKKSSLRSSARPTRAGDESDDDWD